MYPFVFKKICIVSMYFQKIHLNTTVINKMRANNRKVKTG